MVSATSILSFSAFIAIISAGPLLFAEHDEGTKMEDPSQELVSNLSQKLPSLLHRRAVVTSAQLPNIPISTEGAFTGGHITNSSVIAYLKSLGSETLSKDAPESESTTYSKPTNFGKPMSNVPTTTTKTTLGPITSTKTTFTNGAEIEYWMKAAATAPDEISGDHIVLATTAYTTMSTSSLYSGKHMQVWLQETTSANVGNLTGEPLYTSISNALMSACTNTPDGHVPTTGSPPTVSVTACGEAPTISPIMFTDGEGTWEYNAALVLNINWVNYYSLEALHGMIASLASALNTSSLHPANKWKPEAPQCTHIGFISSCVSDVGPDYPRELANVPGLIGISFTQDTADQHDWPEQQLWVELDVKTVDGSAFSCADGALVTDAIAALALVPGLDFLDFMAVPALGVSATCDALEHKGPGGENEG